MVHVELVMLSYLSIYFACNLTRCRVVALIDRVDGIGVSVQQTAGN